MDDKIRFFFYLAAVIVWVIAALGSGFKLGGKALALVPLGLALWVIPTLWDVGEAAF